MKLLLDREQRAGVLPTIFVIFVTILLLAALYYFSHIWAFLGKLLSLLSPFFIGFAIAFMLNPLRTGVLRLLRRFVFRKDNHPRLARGIAAAVSLAVLMGIVVLFLNFVLPQIYKSLESIYRYVTLFLKQNEDTINRILLRYNFLNMDEGSLSLAWENIVSSQFKNITTVLYTLINVSGSAVNFVYRLLVGSITAFYLMLDQEILLARFKKLTYALFSAERSDTLVFWARKSNHIFSGFISGKVLDSLIIGALCYLFMTIVGWPYAVLISCIVGVTNIIPFFGPFIGWVPGALIMLMDSPMRVLWFSIFILVLQQIDGNIIGPFILGDSVGVSALSIMVSIVVGSGLFGFVGMLLAVPVYALCYAIIKAHTYEKLRRKGLPTDTNKYVGLAPVVPDTQPQTDGANAEAGSPEDTEASDKEPADKG